MLIVSEDTIHGQLASRQSPPGKKGPKSKSFQFMVGRKEKRLTALEGKGPELETVPKITPLYFT